MPCVLLLLGISLTYASAASLPYRHGFDDGRLTYRAAVYEHAVKTPVIIATDHSQAVSQMMDNLLVYKEQARIASAQNVDIMIFPEYGIYGFVLDRDYMSHYIENIPDVTPDNPWIPCDDPTRYSQMLDVVIFLSCLAKNNSMYIVANYGDAKSCNNHVDPNCPTNNQYQYNTDVAFDKKGTLIARYHKKNLYGEAQFDVPVVTEYVYFDTDFGRFGVFTCFDILFHDPMVPLLSRYNITDVAFPTAWMDALPYFSAIGYHSSVAAAYNLNVLAANIHLPLNRFQGSGIYTPSGANVYYYSRSSPDGRLLIADVDIIKSNSMPRISGLASNNNQGQHLQHNVSLVHKDSYNTVLLNKDSANLTVCQGDLCCFLEYRALRQLSDLYAFGVFSGRHKGNTYYIQQCILFKCASNDAASCGRLEFDAKTRFSFLRMSGTFGTRFVTPQVVLTDNGSLILPRKHLMSFANGELTAGVTSYPVLESSLLGRYYDRD